MNSERCCNLTRDLILPTLLFAALGGMSWAVRGSSGFGGEAGCIFAGVLWGTAWWFLARDSSREQSRRYHSGWIIVALTFGIGISGARGWMQWPHFFDERLYTDWPRRSVPISRAYGFLWLFIAGVPWAGLGACLLAWCGSLRETRAWHWLLRIACGVGGAALLHYLIQEYPQFFLPLYRSLEDKYNDLEVNPSLQRLINDNTAALVHLGFYLGFLLFEAIRREWKNAVLILTVGLVNGAGWAACQNWKWAPHVFPNANFNFWRCWESSGGISIGLAYGIAYFLVNRPMGDEERRALAARRSTAGPNFEWLIVFSGLAVILCLFIRPQMGLWTLRGDSVAPIKRLPGQETISFGLGNVYFTLLLVFAAVYYMANRKVPLGAAAKPSWAGRLGGFEPVALGFVAASIAFLYRGEGMMAWTRHHVRGLTGTKTMQFFLGPDFDLLRFGYYYLAAVCGLAILYLLLRRRAFAEEKTRTTPIDGDPNLERLGAFLGVLGGLGLSIRNGLKGWFNVYRGNEKYWSRVLSEVLGPVWLVCLVVLLAWVLLRPWPRDYGGRLFCRAYGVVWLVLIVQNVIAQLITGPLSNWNETVFNIYYLLLFAITAVIVIHFQSLKRDVRQ